jgi:hypothetical protein
MAIDSEFVTALLRVIKLRGRDCIESVFLGEFNIVSNQGGGKLVNTSVGGKSFSFALPSNMGADQLMIACDRALRHWDSLDATQRALMFTTRRITKTRAVFSS